MGRTQDNKLVDITSTFSMKTLIDINNKKIFLSRRQYSELKSLELHLENLKNLIKLVLLVLSHSDLLPLSLKIHGWI